MRRRCDACGAEMVLRSHDARSQTEGGTSDASSESWWDCACGRTVMEFSASSRASVPFAVEDESE